MFSARTTTHTCSQLAKMLCVYSINLQMSVHSQATVYSTPV